MTQKTYKLIVQSELGTVYQVKAPDLLRCKSLALAVQYPSAAGLLTTLRKGESIEPIRWTGFCRSVC